MLEGVIVASSKNTPLSGGKISSRPGACSALGPDEPHDASGETPATATTTEARAHLMSTVRLSCVHERRGTGARRISHRRAGLASASSDDPASRSFAVSSGEVASPGAAAVADRPIGRGAPSLPGASLGDRRQQFRRSRRRGLPRRVAVGRRPAGRGTRKQRNEHVTRLQAPSEMVQSRIMPVGRPRLAARKRVAAGSLAARLARQARRGVGAHGRRSGPASPKPPPDAGKRP